MKNLKLTIRISPEEKEALEIHAAEAGVSVSKYVLDAALSEEKILDEESKSLVFQLRKLGNNFNQALILLRRKGIEKNTLMLLAETAREMLSLRQEVKDFHQEYLKLLHENYQELQKIAKDEIKYKTIQAQTEQIRVKQRNILRRLRHDF